MRIANLTSVAAWAKGLGISRAAGYQAVKRCGIPVMGGKLDAEVATTLYERYTRARIDGGWRPEPRQPSGLANFERARDRVMALLHADLCTARDGDELCDAILALSSAEFEPIEMPMDLWDRLTRFGQPGGLQAGADA